MNINQSTMEKIVLGFDPGGKNGFGVAVISRSAVEAGTVSNVREAID